MVALDLTVFSDFISGGFVGSIYNYANIKNTSVHGAKVTVEGDMYIGGFIGSFSGTQTMGKLYIDNSYVYSVNYKGHVKLNNDGGNADIGGFIARINRVDDMSITNCFSCIVVEAVGTGVVQNAGGFAGYLFIEGTKGVILNVIQVVIIEVNTM